GERARLRLLHDARSMRIDCLRAHTEIESDYLVRLAAENALEDFQLAFGKRGENPSMRCRSSFIPEKCSQSKPTLLSVSPLSRSAATQPCSLPTLSRRVLAVLCKLATRSTCWC